MFIHIRIQSNKYYIKAPELSTEYLNSFSALILMFYYIIFYLLEGEGNGLAYCIFQGLWTAVNRRVAREGLGYNLISAVGYYGETLFQSVLIPPYSDF